MRPNRGVNAGCIGCIVGGNRQKNIFGQRKIHRVRLAGEPAGQNTAKEIFPTQTARQTVIDGLADERGVHRNAGALSGCLIAVTR